MTSNQQLLDDIMNLVEENDKLMYDMLVDTASLRELQCSLIGIFYIRKIHELKKGLLDSTRKLAKNREKINKNANKLYSVLGE